MKSISYESQSAGMTQALGERLIQGLTTGGVIALHGDLGAGKTTFVQGLAQALGIQHPITSPTFTLMQLYPTLHHAIIEQLIHLDLYRINNPADLITLDLPHLAQNQKNLLVIEWPERGPDTWLHYLGSVRFDIGSGHHRTLTFTDQLAALVS